eukprot:234793_1
MKAYLKQHWEKIHSKQQNKTSKTKAYSKQQNNISKMKTYSKQQNNTSKMKAYSKQQNNTSKMNTNTYLKDNFFYRCHMCGKGFCDLYAFNMHMNGHTGDDECVQCRGKDCQCKLLWNFFD